MLSKKAKYAIHALLYLAERRGQGPVLIKDIAESERLPRKFLEAILVDLKAGGLLRSRSGRSGGYELIRSPLEVNLGQVIRLMDGPLAPIPCVSQMAYAPCDDCKDERTCLIRLTMKEVRDVTARILENTTLDGLLKQKEHFRTEDALLDFTI
jgi:Rrf2 family protein